MSCVHSEIRRRTLAEGFDLVGVARSGAATTHERYLQWLAHGMHGAMAYLDRTADQRDDVDRLLPGCRSVVVAAMSYRSSYPESRDIRQPGRVWISRYAWGRDYHKLMRKRLVAVGRWISAAVPGSTWRVCVDTAPILEREWAARAGIGWIGKSTMLINRRFGSELFLGVLLTDVEIEPNPPASAHCGSCTACLDACPTRALIAPGVLDSRRCIAYLTVEHRGAIDADRQKLLGHHVAGCDICNEVCPFTRRAPTDIHPEFSPSPHRFHPRIEDLSALDEDGWRLWRQGSTLKRIPFVELQRNLSIALEAHTSNHR